MANLSSMRSHLYKMQLDAVAIRNIASEAPFPAVLMGIVTLSQQQAVRAGIDKDSTFSSLVSALHQIGDIQRSLSAAKSNIRSKLNQTRARLAPINFLPVEVLGDIFAFACSETPGEFDHHHLLHPPVTHTISHVCRLWRAVALSRGALWSVAHLEWPIAMQQAWIERSRNQPLHIYNISSSPATRSSHAISSSGRWRSIVFVRTESSEFFQELNQAGDLGMLESMYLSHPTGPTFKMTLPRLRRLHLFQALPHFIYAPSSLTRLQIRDIDVYDHRLLDFVMHFPMLESLFLLHVNLDARDEDVGSAEPSFALRRLTELHFAFPTCGSYVADAVFRSIETPKLSKLTMEYSTSCNHDLADHRFDHVVTFFSRLCELEELTIRCGDGYTRMLLSRLAASYSGFSSAESRPSGSASMCLPKLKLLKYIPHGFPEDELSGCQESDIDYDECGSSLESFLENRFNVLSSGLLPHSGPSSHGDALLNTLMLAWCPEAKVEVLKRSTRRLVLMIKTDEL